LRALQEPVWSIKQPKSTTYGLISTQQHSLFVLISFNQFLNVNFMKYFTILFVLTTALLFSCNTQQDSNTVTDTNKTAQQTAPNTTTGAKQSQLEGALINWITFEELESKMKDEPRKVVVDLYTDWCGWCKRMDKATFQHPKVAEYVNKNFYAVKFDAEGPNTINFNGQQWEFMPNPNGRKGTHRLAATLILGNQPTGRIGYPTIAFMDEKLQRIDAFPGYKTPDKFEGLIKFINENHYRNQPFDQFMQKFTPTISENPTGSVTPVNSDVKTKLVIK